ncbi:8099_t:CDS:2 [Racocetra persica]|uniref:8099_t:CDS:1 n=1 Tax=Racocetra persica TaxID=160502 RepID=A0ACA9L0E9_9GLOM|nr:8099_t:CDS:2 [Racocetra persica]
MKLIYFFCIFLTFSYWSLAQETTDGLYQVDLTYRNISTKYCYALALIKTQLLDNIISGLTSSITDITSDLGINNLLSKRAGSSQAIGAVNYANDVEWISQISMGTPQQSSLVVLDTGSADLWIPCIDCYNCKNKRLYDYTQSSTIQYNGDDFSITYADGSSSKGWMEMDTLQVGYMTIQDQQFAMVYDMSKAFQTDVIDGVVGCGYDSLSVYSGTQTPLTNMYNQGLIPQRIFSVQLRPARNKTTYGGIFIFGGIDSRLYTGSITYTPVTYKYFWQIGIDAVLYNGNNVFTSSRNKQQVIIDTATALLIVGTNVARTLHSNMRGKYDSSSQTWQVPCNLNSNVQVSIKINGVTLQINYQDLVRERVSSLSSWCYSGIASTDSSIWIFGGTFMKNYYVIFDRERDRVGFATPVYAY